MYRSAHPPKFVSDAEKLDECLRSAKLRQCPHCNQSGTLIGHGFLRGYAERGNQLVIRGRRLFCSDRFLRPGCGRTVAVLLAWILPRFSVRAPTLFEFTKAVVGGKTRRAAWLLTNTSRTSLATSYRLWRRLLGAQSYLRTLLATESAPPQCSGASEPLAQLLEHFVAEFTVCMCPFTALQSRLQRPLLP